jgi:hypothetical protein
VSQCRSCWRPFKKRAAKSRRPTSRRQNTDEWASDISRRPSNRQPGKFQPNPYFWFTRASAYGGRAPTWRQPTRGFPCDTTRTRIGVSQSASTMICERCWRRRRGDRCAHCAQKSSSGCGRRSTGTKTRRRHDDRPLQQFATTKKGPGLRWGQKDDFTCVTYPDDTSARNDALIIPLSRPRFTIRLDDDLREVLAAGARLLPSPRSSSQRVNVVHHVRRIDRGRQARGEESRASFTRDRASSVNSV